MGLSLPLDGFSFAFPHHSALSISINPELQDHADRSSCWQYRPTPDYLMAICAERHVDDAPAISLGKLKWQKMWDARAVSLSHQEAMARVLRYSGFWS